MALDPIITGAAIGAVGSLIGSKKNTEASMKAAAMNARLQEKFAKHGVRWRVQDAQAAGIHPLAALGMNPTQATPVHVGAKPGAGIEKATAHMSDALMQKAVQDSEDISMLNKQLLAKQVRKLQFEGDNEYFDSLIKKKEAIQGKKGRSLDNPDQAQFFYKDIYTGEVIVGPNPELSEGGEGAVGSKLFWYSNIKQHGKNIFDFFEGPQRR